MTLTIAATGQTGELEEVTESGFYLRVQGHARYFTAEQVTHPAPVCPVCGAALGTICRRSAGNGLIEYVICRAPACDYEKRKG